MCLFLPFGIYYFPFLSFVVIDFCRIGFQQTGKTGPSGFTDKTSPFSFLITIVELISFIAKCVSVCFSLSDDLFFFFF